MNITQLKHGSLNGLRKQTNECLDAAYNKGYEEGAKNQDEVQYKNGYDNALEDFEKIFIHEHDYEQFFEDTYGSKDPDYNLYDLVAEYGAKKVLNDFKKWQEEKKKRDEEIKVGDEVMHQHENGIITSIHDGYYRILLSDGFPISETKSGFVKTGRHFDELQQLLEKMKE